MSKHLPHRFSVSAILPNGKPAEISIIKNDENGQWMVAEQAMHAIKHARKKAKRMKARLAEARRALRIATENAS
jgi:hypothetical protein